MTNRRTWILISFLLIVFMVISFFLLSKQPKLYPVYVSDSPSPSGTKAIYSYLENEAGSVSRWSHSPDLLMSLDEPSLLIMISPHWMLNPDELNAYRDFMYAGNKILLLNDHLEGIFDLETVQIEDNLDEDYVDLLDSDGNEYQAKVSSFMRLQSGDDDEVLFYDLQGTVALKRSFGQGELIAVNTPEWMRNDNILNYDHVHLILELIKEAAVDDHSIIFDEYIHDKPNASTITTLYPQWFIILMLQVGLLTIVWLWYQGKRFGPVFKVKEEYVRFSDEGIRALGAWYLRGRRYHDSLSIQADYVRLRMQERWGIPYSKNWDTLEDYLERKWRGVSSAEIKSFLQDFNGVLNKSKMSKQEYLLWSNNLDRLRKEVDKDETRIRHVNQTV